MIKQGNKVISNTQIKILSSNEITKETIENVLTGEIVSHTHDGTYVKKDDPRLSDSRPASDVSAWAKASIKPSYSAFEITGLSNVAKTGSYNDLSNKPTIPTVDVNKAYVDGALATKADLVSGKIPLSQLPEIPSPITIDSSLSSTSTNPVQNKVINTALENKVDKVSGKGLSTNDYTTTEKNKLSRIGWIVYRDPSIEYEKGSIVFSTYSIDPNSGSSNKSSFDIRGADSSSSGIMTASDKNKLDGIATGANNYIHPATSGNKHIPAGGASGQILRWSSDGTAVWGADNNTTYSVVGANGSTGLVKNGSSVTNASGYTTCPIIGGVPYYKDTTYMLPTATGSILGGVKTGANITNSSGTISITKSNITSALGYTPAEECLLIEYIDMVGDTTPKTITEAQYNDIWNAVKNNKKIKIKYSLVDSNLYVVANCTYGLCYGPTVVQCVFGSLYKDAKCITVTANKQSECTFDCHINNGIIDIGSNSDMFLANDGSYYHLPNVSKTQSGIVNALPDDATKFLDGKGNWSTVNTVLKPGVSDILKRVADTGEGVTVTQAEWDILVAATPEVDKTYFFSVTEEFINNGIGMCYDKGFITRSTSSVNMLINGILPQYSQYLAGVSVDATTKACSMIVYGSMIVGGSNGLSISSVVSDGDNSTSSGLTLKTNGDGSKALMDNGGYKNILPYIIPKAVAKLTKSSTSTEIETAFGSKEQMYRFVETIRNNGSIFMEDTPVVGSKIGFWPIALHVIISTANNISIVIKGQFSDKKCGDIGFIFNNASSVSSISPSIYTEHFTVYDSNPIIKLPDNFSASTTYTSDQIKSMLEHTSWESFYNNFINKNTTKVMFPIVENGATNKIYYSPSEVVYMQDFTTKTHVMYVTIYGTLLSVTQASSGISLAFTYSETDSIYDLNVVKLGQL